MCVDNMVMATLPAVRDPYDVCMCVCVHLLKGSPVGV
jgi:hypothetical protein